MVIETFEDLRVWQRGIELVKRIYLLTKEGELSRDFGLRDQLRRAAVSVPTNIPPWNLAVCFPGKYKLSSNPFTPNSHPPSPFQTQQ